MDYKRYSTIYPIDGDNFLSEFYAKNDKDAEKLCTKRGIGEKIGGFQTKGYFEFEKLPSDIFDLIHMVTFCSWIGIKSGKYTVDEILSDTGILHDLIHQASEIETLNKEEELNIKIEELFRFVFNFPDNHSF